MYSFSKQIHFGVDSSLLSLDTSKPRIQNFLQIGYFFTTCQVLNSAHLSGHFIYKIPFPEERTKTKKLLRFSLRNFSDFKEI